MVAKLTEVRRERSCGDGIVLRDGREDSSHSCEADEGLRSTGEGSAAAVDAQRSSIAGNGSGMIWGSGVEGEQEGGEVLLRPFYIAERERGC